MITVDVVRNRLRLLSAEREDNCCVLHMVDRGMLPLTYAECLVLRAGVDQMIDAYLLKLEKDESE